MHTIRKKLCLLSSFTTVLHTSRSTVYNNELNHKLNQIITIITSYLKAKCAKDKGLLSCVTTKIIVWFFLFCNNGKHQMIEIKNFCEYFNVIPYPVTIYGHRYVTNTKYCTRHSTAAHLYLSPPPVRNLLLSISISRDCTSFCSVCSSRSR